MIFGFLIIFDLPIYCKGETTTVLQIFLNNAAFDYSKGVLSGYVINPIWLIAFIFTLFTCSVFDKKFKITYAMYTFSTVLYLSLGLKGMLYLRSLTNIVGEWHQVISGEKGCWKRIECHIMNETEKVTLKIYNENNKVLGEQSVKINK